MRISGFTYVRNGLELGYPFIESIRSILPICDEVVVAVGDSHDGTREAVEAIDPKKIKIVDTVWDMQLRKGGKVFAQQSNAALDAITGEWAIHIQADEVMHEKDLPLLLQAIQDNEHNEKVDGFIQPFLHFWGTYDYIRTSRKVHKHEIRVFRNNKYIRAYSDSQGFRIYRSADTYNAGEKGKKLHVKKIDAPVYHYNAVRPAPLMNKKRDNFLIHWNVENKEKEFDYQKVDRLEKFTGEHPAVMKDLVENMNWHFEFDPAKAYWEKKKDKYLQPIEDFLGIRIGEYKNYILLKK